MAASRPVLLLAAAGIAVSHGDKEKLMQGLATYQLWYRLRSTSDREQLHGLDENLKDTA